MVYYGLYNTTEHMDSDPFMVKDDRAYVNAHLQKIIVNSTIMHKKK